MLVGSKAGAFFAGIAQHDFIPQGENVEIEGKSASFGQIWAP